MIALVCQTVIAVLGLALIAGFIAIAFVRGARAAH
jgi:hypothetical protein